MRPRNLLPAGLLVAAVSLHACDEPAPGKTAAHDGYPSWSPDGQRIVFYSNRDGNGEIYTVKSDGTDLQRLTRTAANEGYPNYSPDGKKILFDSDHQDNIDLFVMDADGSNPERLTLHPSRDNAGSWSPDGRRIAFMSDRDGEFQVYVMDANGNNQQRFSGFSRNFFPRWSPDGSELAFHTGVDIRVYKLDRSGSRRLTRDPENGMYPTWSPDGAHLAFMSWRGGPDMNSTEIYRMKSDGSEPRRLTFTAKGTCIDPRWSPRGDRIVYVYRPTGKDPSGPSILYVMDANGENQHPLLR